MKITSESLKTLTINSDGSGELNGDSPEQGMTCDEISVSGRTKYRLKVLKIDEYFSRDKRDDNGKIPFLME
jgi:hypothetical protein